MSTAKQRAAALLGDTAALVVLDLLIARMRNRAITPSSPGQVSRHPWLMAVVVEAVAQFSDAIVFQRRRAAAAIDRAVAVQNIPPTTGSAVPGARSASPLPAPRVVTPERPLPRSSSTSET